MDFIAYRLYGLAEEEMVIVESTRPTIREEPFCSQWVRVPHFERPELPSQCEASL